MSARSDLRLALLLTRGADRLERRRALLTALGATAATCFASSAVALGSVRGQVSFSFGNGLLDQPGTRRGVVTGLLLLLIPVLGFLAQCARVGAVHRDRRLAALRLAGAGPRRVRRIAALEAGLACLAGAAAGFVLFSAVAATGHVTEPPTWAACALTALAIPVAGTLVSALALRRVVASPLGHVRLERRTGGPGLLVGLGVPLCAVLIGAAPLLVRGSRGDVAALPALLVGVVVLTGAAAIWASGAAAKAVGRRLATRAERPEVLLAAHRLQQDPWAASRSHAALVLVTVVGVGLAGIHRILLDQVAANERETGVPQDVGYYTYGLNVTVAAVLIALLICLVSLATGTAESLSSRRGALAAQAAAGVPYRVQRRTLLLETVLPLAPALVLATIGGTALHTAYALATGVSVPWALPLLVPVLVLTACAVAVTTTLPLLRRSVHPSQLRAA
ncbi:FtsX-like permease family protein [Streptomyces sp. cg28]|uniref:FtsX-like permease family protein n=1 Tax=Streptomyces sp. cg28 TaxID=3403457 RepID=UPI003B224EC7